MQQLAFFFPQLDDQELSNIVYKSNLTCLVPPELEPSTGCLQHHALSIQYKDPRYYVSGHYYCHRHEVWAELQVKPKLIHLNGDKKEQCIANSKDWGYEMVQQC